MADLTRSLSVPPLNSVCKPRLCSDDVWRKRVCDDTWNIAEINKSLKQSNPCFNEDLQRTSGNYEDVKYWFICTALEQPPWSGQHSQHLIADISSCQYSIQPEDAPRKKDFLFQYSPGYFIRVGQTLGAEKFNGACTLARVQPHLTFTWCSDSAKVASPKCKWRGRHCADWLAYDCR